MKTRKYRIVRDRYLGFEAQVKYWWWPFWIQCRVDGNTANTHVSVDSAKKYIEKHRNYKKVVWKEATNG